MHVLGSIETSLLTRVHSKDEEDCKGSKNNVNGLHFLTLSHTTKDDSKGTAYGHLLQ